MAILSTTRGTHQSNHIMRMVSVRGPNLLPIKSPPVSRRLGTAAHAGQVRARIGLTHANAEKSLATHNTGQIKLTLFLRPITQNQWPTLPVSNPMRRDRSASAQ